MLHFWAFSCNCVLVCLWVCVVGLDRIIRGVDWAKFSGKSLLWVYFIIELYLEFQYQMRFGFLGMVD